MNKKFLQTLLSTVSPSGYESDCVKVFEGYCGDFAKYEFSDAIGNTCFSVGKEGGKRIMLSGHCDEIALQVQHVDDNGFIYFIKDGGTDAKTLLGSRVHIISKSGKLICGVIGKAPIHIDHKEEKMPKISDMKIDIGTETKAETLSLISIGDPIIVGDLIPTRLGEHKISSRGCDDKVGVFIVAEVLKELSKHKLKNVIVYGTACTQEEVGGHGAHSAAKRIDPNYSIDFDVTFATDDGYVDAKEWGDIKLGKGGAIAHSTDCNPWLVNLIRQNAIMNNIPYQEFSVRSGGTDTLPIKMASTNAQTALISIPNRNMHTNVEVIDLRDLQSIIDMTVATILKLDTIAN